MRRLAPPCAAQRRPVSPGPRKFGLSKAKILDFYVQLLILTYLYSLKVEKKKTHNKGCK